MQAKHAMMHNSKKLCLIIKFVVAKTMFESTKLKTWECHPITNVRISEQVEPS